MCVLLLQSIKGTWPCTLPAVFWPFVQSFSRKHKESIEQRLMASIATSFSLQIGIFFPPLLKEFSSKPWDRCKNRIKHKSIFWPNSVFWSWIRPEREYFVIALAENQGRMKRSQCWCYFAFLGSCLSTAIIQGHMCFPECGANTCPTTRQCEQQLLYLACCRRHDIKAANVANKYPLTSPSNDKQTCQTPPQRHPDLQLYCVLIVR